MHAPGRADAAVSVSGAPVGSLTERCSEPTPVDATHQRL